ncbi:hypothetical protein HNQ91_002484 [Filimonas zeae]|nr:hypothetical protein [Filimonas zeae]
MNKTGKAYAGTSYVACNAAYIVVMDAGKKWNK